MQATTRAARFALLAIALALLAQLAFLAARRGLDLDEPHFLHEGWLAAQGLRIYADYWSDHGPAAPAFFSLGYRAAPLGDAAGVRVGRALVALLLLASAALTWRIARCARPDDPLFAPLALLLFAASPLIARKGIEIRGDNLQQPIWLLALWLWLRAAASGSTRAFGAAGLALGAGFLATQKTAMLGVACGAMFAAWCAGRRRFEGRAIGAFALGSLAIPALLLAFQAATGGLRPFLQEYVLDSARGRYPLAQGFMSLRQDAPLAAPLALLALLGAALAALRGRLPTAIACLAACGAALVFQYLFLLPVHFLHALLPAAAPVALVTAWWLQRIFEGGADGNAWRRAGLAAACCAIAAFELSARRADPRALARELADAERVAAIVPPGAWLFDGDALPIAYRRPLRAPAFPLFVQGQILSGRYPEDVVAELDRRDVGWWQDDTRTRAIGRRFAVFRAANYVALGHDLYVAGQVVPAAAGGEAELPIRIAGAYHWLIGGRSDAALRVDGAPAPNPVALGDGVHRVAWSGSAPLVVALAAPELWPPALRSGEVAR